MKIKVVGHYVLVKPEREGKKLSRGGIIIPKGIAAREDVASVRGKIVGVGDNAWKAFNQGESGPGKPWAKVGQNVFFKRHVSDRIEDKDDLDEDGEPEEYFLMNDENILAIIED